MLLIAYAWNNTATTEDVIGLTAATYSVTVTDANGCTATELVEIIEPEPFTVDSPENVIACSSYSLPELSSGDYYTEPNGEGDMLLAEDEVTISQTLYVYGENISGCVAENEFDILIEENDIAEVTFTDESFAYDGNSHSISVKNLPYGATVSYENNNQTNAGIYKVTATVTSANKSCGSIDISANLIINKAETVITASSPQTFVYDGSEKNVAATLNHEETELTYIPQQGYTDAGTYEIMVSTGETDNYLAASEEVTLVIENAEMEGVTFTSTSFVYDGTAKSIEVEGLPGDATVSYANNEQINAGTYEVTATITRKNFDDLELRANLIINKAETVITASSPQTFVYDGSEKNVAATLNHDETELTYIPQQGYTDAGTYAIMVSAGETDNYLAASEEVTLVIENAEMEGVTFTNASFVYDGTVKSIEAEGLPGDATVSYANNEQINAGTYEVTATITRKNFDDLELHATLTITQAQQIITFEEIETRDIATDDGFQLSATSSSGLPVRYTFISEDESPIANVSEDGKVILLEAGEILITAYQDGNSNYQEAETVTRVLTVINSEAEEDLDPVITIAGIPYTNPSETIYYLMDCGNSDTEVNIEVEVDSDLEITPGRSFNINIPAPGIYTDVIEISSNGDISKSYTIVIEKQFNFSDIVKQKFNNVLLVNNNSSTNGGYRFTEYKWFKDGEYIGSGQYYSAGNRTTDRLDQDGQYYVELLTEEGQRLRTCVSGISVENSNQALLAPSPIRAGYETEFYADFSEEELKGMKISIANLNGKIIKQLKTSARITKILIPANAQQGVYILTYETNIRVESIKFFIQ